VPYQCPLVLRRTQLLPQTVPKQKTVFAPDNRNKSNVPGDLGLLAEDGRGYDGALIWIFQPYLLGQGT